MVVARLAELERPVLSDFADFDDRHLGLHEVGHRQVLRLAHRVGKHDAERHPLAVPPRRVESELPDRMEIEPPWPRLHVAPVAADVEHLGEGKTGHLLDVLFERLAPGARGLGGTGLLPRVSDQSRAEIRDRPFGRGRGRDREPAVVLFNSERTLVEPVHRNRPRAKIVSRPEVCGHVRPSRAGKRAQRRGGLEPVTSVHGGTSQIHK